MHKLLFPTLLTGLLSLGACSTTPPDPRLGQLQQAREQYQRQRTATGHTLDSLATTGTSRLRLPTAYLTKYQLLSPRLGQVSDSLLALTRHLPTGQLTPVQDADLTKWLHQQQGLAEWEMRRRQEGRFLVARLAGDYQLLDKLQKQNPTLH